MRLLDSIGMLMSPDCSSPSGGSLFFERVRGEYRLVLTSDRNNREHGPRDKSMTRLDPWFLDMERAAVSIGACSTSCFWMFFGGIRYPTKHSINCT